MEDDENKKEKNKNLIFGRYKIIKKLDEGSFGKVYSGLNTKTNEKVAIKLEPKSNPVHFLETEAYYLYILRGVGIPKLVTFGHNEKYNILVESLLGKSLHHLFYERNKNFSLKDILMIAIQIIDRIKFIHSKHIIHRDVKPENFLIGYNDPYIIYLIDFGLSKKYRSGRTGKHVKFSVPKRTSGTARYSSLNSLRGFQVSRRDDLESVVNLLIFLMKGHLPWEKIEAKTKKDKYRKICKLKMFLTPEKICQKLPNEICEFLKYTRNLDFEQEPNYEYCCSLFNNILIKNGLSNDLIFSWIQNSSILNKLKNRSKNKDILDAKSSNYKIYDISKRKSSPQTRIYHYLQNSFEKKRLNSFFNMNDLTLEDNHLSSDKKRSTDSNIQKSNDYNSISKSKIDDIKINSLTTNFSSQINYYQNKDINYNNKYNQEIKVPAFNIYINETKKFNNNTLKQKNTIMNKKLDKLNLSNNFIQCDSERDQNNNYNVLIFV